MENNNESQKSEKKKVSSSHVESITFFLLFLSLLAVLLYFVGYGVALSATIMFNLPHESLFNSTFDLLELSAWAIATITSKLLEFDVYKYFFIDYISQVWIPALIFIILMSSVIVCSKKFSKNIYKSPMLSMLPNFFKLPTKSDSYFSWITKLFVYVYGFLLLIPTLVFALIFMTIVFVAIIPSIAMEAGAYYIWRNVIEPTSCSPVLSRETLMKKLQVKKVNQQHNTAKPTKTENFATCISLTKENDSSVIFKGRLVYMTTSAVILFDPDSGNVRRVPTQNMTISMIDKL